MINGRAAEPSETPHRTRVELEARLDYVRQSPASEGRLELLVRRRQVGSRDVLNEGTLDPVHGLVGDNWSVRGSSSMSDRSSDPNKQITMMNARAAELRGAFCGCGSVGWRRGFRTNNDA